MILTRTPLRISFVGGGTDMPWFYNEHEGAVISATIDKYVYVMVNPRFDLKSLRLAYSTVETVADAKDLQHDIARETLLRLGIRSGLEIATVADVPAGTGLGSSSAFTVGLLKALANYADWQLIDIAAEIEINRCKHPIGEQDHCAAVWGGLNQIVFKQSGIEWTPLLMPPAIHQSLLLLYTGGQRQKMPDLREDKDVTKVLLAIRDLTKDLRASIAKEDPVAFGSTVNMGGALKQTLKSAHSEMAANAIRTARNMGAYGGKLCGAGGGGFLLICAPPDTHQKIVQTLGFRHVPFEIETQGSRRC